MTVERAEIKWRTKTKQEKLSGLLNGLAELLDKSFQNSKSRSTSYYL